MKYLINAKPIVINEVWGTLIKMKILKINFENN